MTRWVPAVIATAVLAAACSQGQRLVVAAGTTLVDSGLVERVVADFEDTHPGVQVSVVGDSTAQVLALARNGAADVTITHSPDQEQAFINDGSAAVESIVFQSRFLLIGPSGYRPLVEGLSAPDALSRLVEAAATFVSRDDGSGTHRAEQELWRRAGIDPAGSRYLRTGLGMGETLQVADQRQAVTLAEEGSFLRAARSLSIIDLGVSSEGLQNPYRAMAVAASPQADLAVEFVWWLTSPEGSSAVARADQELFGNPVFIPIEP